MKKLLIILITIFSLNSYSQDVRFNAFTYTDVVATTIDGFNIGVGIEYQMTLMYFKAQVFVFPDLRGKTYTEITGTPLGFNYHFANKHLRLSSGLKLGVINRDGGAHPTYGGEIGLEYYFNGEQDGFYTGVMLSRDRRTDGKVWDKDILPYWRNSSFLRVGFTF